MWYAITKQEFPSELGEYVTSFIMDESDDLPAHWSCLEHAQEAFKDGEYKDHPDRHRIQFIKIY